MGQHTAPSHLRESDSGARNTKTGRLSIAAPPGGTLSSQAAETVGTMGEVPRLLRMVVPTDPHCCAGVYRIVENSKVSGHPLWQLDAGTRWLFTSVSEGAWMIGGPEEAAEQFICDEGFITNGVAHNGRMPHEVDEWFYDDEQFEEDFVKDASIKCIVELDAPARSSPEHVHPSIRHSRPSVVPNEMSVPHASQSSFRRSGVSYASAYEDIPMSYLLAAPNDPNQSGGLYLLIEADVNDFPCWQRDDGQRWIYSGRHVGAWLVGGAEEMQQGFDANDGFITNGSPHEGRLPHRFHEWY